MLRKERVNKNRLIRAVIGILLLFLGLSRSSWKVWAAVPQPVNDSAIVAEGGIVTTVDDGQTTVLYNDAPIGGSLIVSTTLTVGPSYGLLTLNSDGTFSYAHDGTENFSDSFDYWACDATAPTDCASATVSITVTPVNDAPTANDDSATVAEGGAVSTVDGTYASVLHDDTDPDSTLTVNTTPVSGPSHGTLILNADGTFSYTHDGSENFSDSFVYQACDGGTPALCDDAT
ncbi:MAG: Ig-like domain-containing protein, partial [Anaerolineae bacterium]